MPLNELQIKIVETLASNNMNVHKTARDMPYSDQGLRYQMRKIHAETGLNPLMFYDLKELLEMRGDDNRSE